MTRLPDPRQLASIAQARARQTPADVQQMSSLMEKVGHVIDALPAQQVGWLADACEVASCSPQSREAFQSKLSETASKLSEPLVRLACCESGFHASMQPLQDFAEVAAQLGADQLGHLGSSLILSSQGHSGWQTFAATDSAGHKEVASFSRVPLRPWKEGGLILRPEWGLRWSCEPRGGWPLHLFPWGLQ